MIEVTENSLFTATSMAPMGNSQVSRYIEIPPVCLRSAPGSPHRKTCLKHVHKETSRSHPTNSRALLSCLCYSKLMPKDEV